MMNNKRPLILISNDDGYHAPGIHALVDMVSCLADIVVCAPESGRSGFAGAITVAEPLLIKRRKNIGQAQVWSCTGTPADCIKIALDEIIPDRRPDMILSGINHGDNASVNTHYSGTMGAAMEGCMKYIPSVAFSSCFYNEDANLEPLRPYVQKIINSVLDNGLRRGRCLNVNFPAADKFNGIKVCRMCYASWTNEHQRCSHPHGYDYFWTIGDYRNDEPAADDTDKWALDKGYVAITPTTVDVTAYDMIDEIKNWNL